MQRIKHITKIGGKALLHLGGNGKILGGIPHLRHHHDDGPDTDGAENPSKTSESSIYLWNESHNEFGAKVTVISSVTANAVLSPTGGVKSIPPTTDNCPRKLYEYSMNNTSTEDKHETNHINNKYNDTNTDTRKLHNM